MGDDYPIDTFGQPSGEVTARVELVDSNGLLPLRAAARTFPVAHAFRRFLQKSLPDHLLDLPRANPLAGARLPPLDTLPREITRCWPAATAGLLAGKPTHLAKLPINHHVQPVATAGGTAAARSVLKRFLRDRLPRYIVDRNRLHDEATSGLSPYLHFGHIAATDLRRGGHGEGWSPARLADRATGKREGWSGMTAGQGLFGRVGDLAGNWVQHVSRQEDYASYESLPAWAAATLARHARDAREYRYSLEEFESARTHDPVWNAAQRQLVQEGRVHNYLRMLWGKKILQWTASAQEALEVMIELNNKYALRRVR